MISTYERTIHLGGKYDIHEWMSQACQVITASLAYQCGKFTNQFNSCLCKLIEEITNMLI